MSLKDVIFADVADVFQDLDELASWHKIGNASGTNTRECLVIKEEDISKDLLEKLNAKYNGYYGQTFTFHANTLELPEVPVENQQIRFDGELYEVAFSSEDLGVATVTLVRLNT